MVLALSCTSEAIVSNYRHLKNCSNCAAKCEGHVSLSSITCTSNTYTFISFNIFLIDNYGMAQSTFSGVDLAKTSFKPGIF